MLPTLVSRVVEIDVVNSGVENEDVTTFLKGSLHDRLLLADDIAGKKGEVKDRNRATSLVQGLLENRHSAKLSPETVKALAVALKYVHLPSSSVKMLIEYIALTFKFRGKVRP